MKVTTKEFLEMDYHQIKSIANKKFLKEWGNFIKEFNRREWKVRIDKSDTFKSFKINYLTEFGYGFNDADGNPVPYFHPNRSFHDEIIWLNEHLFFESEPNFDDKLINSALVKFYGPSTTLDVITEGTKWKYVNVHEFKNNPVYQKKLLDNLEMTRPNGVKIWGTTELRTWIQIAARNYVRSNGGSPVDHSGTDCGAVSSSTSEELLSRKMRPSDVLYWVLAESDKWIEFYRTKPTMKGSFEFLTSYKGIGNYFGYHFSSNLARMPEVGSSTIIDTEFKEEFDKLNVQHGNLDENADYVMAGPGATATFKNLFPDVQVNDKTTTHAILTFRDNQVDLFNISTESELQHLEEASETGRFTTFGMEISMCQYNVFIRCKDSAKIAAQRAKAPISIENDKDKCEIDITSQKIDPITDDW